jgi:phosphoglycerate dehydrogenase-like enzyme
MRLLLATPIAQDAIERLRSRHEVVLGYEREENLADLIADREGLVFRSGVTISAAVLAAAPQLRLVVRAGSGLDNIDLRSARERGIRVARVPGASPQAVAELTLGLILAAARHIPYADAMIRRGRWPKYDLGGPLIAEKTLGIVGAGRIGSRTGQLGAAIGMRVLGCVKRPTEGRADDFARLGITLCDFDTVVSEADVVSIHTPLDVNTAHLIDAQVIEKMKPGTVLVNTARGGVVDEAAVFDALELGHLASAAFDVHEREGHGVIPRLASLPNVVLTPHIGGMALETQSRIGRRVCELIDAFLDGRLDDETTDAESVV